MIRRLLLTYVGLVVFVVVVGLIQGPANIFLLLDQAAAYALIALGLNITFGYGGLFNLAIMGLMMIGAMGMTSLTAGINEAFWHSDEPVLILRALLVAVIGGLVIALAHIVPKRYGVPGRWRFWISLVAWFGAYLAYRIHIDPAASLVEEGNGWVGGLGMPAIAGWVVGGILAGIIAWIIGRISLGLRSDYLAIATIGMSEIIRAFVKNMDWLTHGTLTVTPLPWPVPLPQDFQAGGAGITASFIYARGSFFILMIVLLILAVFLVERAYLGPWGRMMRAIRDNVVAASSMGKDTTSRQLEIFVFGAVLMGIGGAVLATFGQIFDPSGYQPIDSTFLVWVMVIVGGMGNSYGAVFGAIGIYMVWVLADPVSHVVFNQISAWSTSIGWPAIPDIDTRASQMRVFVLGLVITLALRYAPRGILPEVIRRHD
ncbi:MAG TPA: branched-chain amino acid ABC transporter permease [Bauldia sp.]|nr:branched-chain amino acid ABC transporter permease [Bauldia sp.]